MLTKDQVEQALPASLKGAATQQFTDMINNISSDPLVAENVRENFISFTSVLTEGTFKTEDYLNACTYVAFKMMGYSNKEAYFRTFPARYQAMLAKGTTDKDMSSYVSAYSKNKLVNLILERSLVPVHVLYADVYHKAIRTQADLMVNAQSEKVRSDAANSILTHLAEPKKQAAAVQISIHQDSGMSEMKNMLTQLAQRQLEVMSDGVTAKEIAGQKLISGDVIENGSS